MAAEAKRPNFVGVIENHGGSKRTDGVLYYADQMKRVVLSGPGPFPVLTGQTVANIYKGRWKKETTYENPPKPQNQVERIREFTEDERKQMEDAVHLRLKQRSVLRLCRSHMSKADREQNVLNSYSCDLSPEEIALGRDMAAALLHVTYNTRYGYMLGIQELPETYVEHVFRHASKAFGVDRKELEKVYEEKRKRKIAQAKKN
ncbi:MAG: hypothetical protein V1887_01165 [Candidatus Aenigmatarchaeota archaeon]